MESARTAERTFMVTLAAILGLLGGLVAVGFRLLISVVQRGSWGDLPYSLDLVRGHPWWWIILVPAVGGLLVGPLVYFFAREAKGHGVPEVMEAVALRSGVIRPRLVAVKSLASALTIGTGGSVGREGPIVQIGSALGSTLGQWFRVSGSQLRTLVGCGAAAGIAATFNAPVAGALFAVEIVLGDFGVSEFSPIVISSVMATVVSRHFLGDNPAFTVPPHELVSAWELLVYGILGLAAGVIALLFIHAVYGAEDRFESLPLPPWLLPALGGLMVGALAILFPEILGVGYEATGDALWGRHGLGLLTLLVVAKLLATSITLGSGASGGVFAPSLFLGAMTGGLVGGLAHQWFPAVTAGRGAYALVGMGAMVAGTTRAPITAILIIFELTSDYKLILPLMASCIIATLVSSRSRHGSIYTEKLVRRGIDIFRGRELNILRALRTEEVMDRDMMTVAPDRTLGELLETLQSNLYSSLYVVDSDGRLGGVIPMPDLQSALLHAQALAHVVVADELMRQNVPRVAPNQRLDAVMRTFAERHPEELPVVDPENGRLLGIVTRRKVMEAYNRELTRRDVVAGIGGGLETTRTTEVSLGDGYHMAEVDAPAALLQHTLGEIGVRSRFEVQVLLVRRMEGERQERQDFVPGPDTTIRAGDRLVLLGRRAALERLRR
ncbi:MAG TPA: chloride channel protein [Longimicrobiales bacterium]|nr:chloride channel protein [Longimicrobiales bacterium]